MAVDGNATALVVGITAAAATIVVALVNGRASRRDVRDNLARDVALSARLREGSAARITLDRLIERQVFELSLSADTRIHYIARAVAASATLGALAALSIRQYATDPTQIDGGLRSIAWAGAAGYALAAILHRIDLRRRTATLHQADDGIDPIGGVLVVSPLTPAVL